MRVLGPSRYFCVQTPGTASAYLEKVIVKIVSMLENEKAGAVTRMRSTITFKRGYQMMRYSTNRLALFDPGEISVRAKGNEISINYHLGVQPLYMHAGIIFFCVVILCLMPNAHAIILPIGAGGVTLFTVIYCIGMYRVHMWLKAGVASVVAKE